VPRPIDVAPRNPNDTRRVLALAYADPVRSQPPRRMTALLLYGDAVGVFSSRKIERASFEDVAFRILAAGEHPHFTTINEFRAPTGPPSRTCSSVARLQTRRVHHSSA